MAKNAIKRTEKQKVLKNEGLSRASFFLSEGFMKTGLLMDNVDMNPR
jgi:hypothetical protein